MTLFLPVAAKYHFCDQTKPCWNRESQELQKAIIIPIKLDLLAEGEQKATQALRTSFKCPYPSQVTKPHLSLSLVAYLFFLHWQRCSFMCPMISVFVEHLNRLTDQQTALRVIKSLRKTKHYSLLRPRDKQAILEGRKEKWLNKYSLYLQIRSSTSVLTTKLFVLLEYNFVKHAVILDRHCRV